MKKSIILITLALLFLTGCSDSGLEGQVDSAKAQQENLIRKKPRIPRKKPRLPKAENLPSEALADQKKNGAELTGEIDMERLLARINKNLSQPNITAEDFKRRWYYGSREEKKFGTPDGWQWVSDGIKSRWASLDAIEESPDAAINELCRKTGGTYVISCIESEVTNCEYIPQSECRCISGSKWVDEQGCIFADEGGQFVEISADDLSRGWYYGLFHEKKLHTPLSWIWVENGQDSRWQNLSPIN